MSEVHPVDNFGNGQFLSLSRDLRGDNVAHSLAVITINWGKVELAIYQSLKSIDEDRADVWRSAIFHKGSMSKTRERSLKGLEAAIGKSRPQLLKHFRDILTRLKEVQDRRNLLSHGLWLSVDDNGEFVIQPLRFDKERGSFDPVRKIDLDFFSTLIDDMNAVVNAVYALGSELLAYNFLKKYGLLGRST